jgi:hypothetical protein
VDWACSTNGGKEQRAQVVDGNAREEEAVRKTNTQVSGYY